MKRRREYKRDGKKKKSALKKRGGKIKVKKK
jgi:hypothetical protein